MEGVKSLVAERGGVKSKLTVFRKFVESFDVSADIAAFEKRVRAHEGLYERFDVIQSRIETAVVDTPNEQAQLAEREQFEDIYFRIMSKAESRLVHARGEAGPSPFISNSATPVPSDPHPATRLPVIKLPSFDGNLTEWIRFRDTFRSLVHDSERLTDIDRFNYLVSALSGSAARSIESFSVSAANYKLAWCRLRERFDDPKALIAHHINALLDTQPIKKQSGSALGELVDTAVNNVSALDSLLKPEDILDAFVSTCIIRKLDSVSRDEWEKRTMDSRVMPPFKDLAKFLEQRSQYLSRRDTTPSSANSIAFERPKITKPREIRREAYVAASHVAGKPTRCLLCNSEHALQYCPKWLAMPFSEKHTAVKGFGACFNCLSRGHSIRACTRGNCRKCGKRHHTLLHRENVPNKDDVDSPTSSTSHIAQSCIANSATMVADCAVLSTALVLVTDRQGKTHKCRALLDVGSQANFITRDFCDRVSLPRRAADTVISGVGRVQSKISSTAHLRIASVSDNYHTALSCLVIDNITDEMPNVPLERVKISIPSGVIPADPEFQRPGRVDLLIGCGLFWDLLCIGQIRIGLGNLMWQKTRLGWVLGGSTHWPTASANGKPVRACHAITNAQLEKSVARFWEVEELQNIESLEGTDPCEQHFQKNTTRDERGRFVVGIPFNDRVHELGESRAQAERRLLNMERKCRKNPDFGKQYRDFLREYLELGHMTKLDAKDVSSLKNSFYLPHHAVMKENSTTTKLRVVFDGSAKTSTGISLNDAQLVGRPVQDDLFSILVRFRKHRIVLSADIAKMYRQVTVRPEDRKYQMILWRSSDSNSIGTYTLNTVTYGTASASYLATRALRQVGKDCALSHPFASEKILKDFYVDDLLTGCETLEQATDLRESITWVLAQAGFPLRKWASNDPKAIVLDSGDTHSLEFKTIDREAKTLGLLWSASTDELTYSSQYKEYPRTTKRYILAEIAQIFDPLGLIGPLIVKAKLFMQRLWALKIGWDESLPQDLHFQWLSFRNEMSEISSVRIPRRVLLSHLDIEVHGFSDASERAYGAAVYLRSRADNRSWIVQLLCAKSRVAPLKTLSLPRLELCGAVLLAQLLSKVKESLQIGAMREYYWTDSQIVLAWIKDRPCKWKTFVANRTAEIQTLTSAGNWFHVKSADNPADLLSRGTTLSVLRDSDLWWHGPDWLATDGVKWPHFELGNIEAPEERPNSIVQLAASVNCESLLINLATRYSCFDKFVRIVACIFRFYSNIRDKGVIKTSGQRHFRPLCVAELASAERTILRAIQGHSFSKEIHKLKAGQPLDKNSSLLSLHPFLDEHEILRVGGRLQNAPIAFSQKHPVLIPNSSPLAILLIRREHLRLLHAGCQQTLASLHSRYWVISGRRVTRKVLRNCMKCFRSNPGGLQPQMGTLPTARVTPARAFATCGVDYAGPFLLVERGRARTVRKAYICLFVCMVTKAIHIELAVDLTTDAFLNCLHRFISRRGKCLSLYSDNGTNFIGARNELKELGILLSSRSHNDKVTEALAQEHIEWHLIPPRAPHFGGLWERGVRSVKAHMRRVIGEQKLTFEELYTVLTQIEACLNSRPLHPLSPDPSDLNPLTPGHFLVGEALMALPQADLGHITPNRLSRFQLLQQMLQHFWKRWQRDYLHGLQQRQKWRLGSPDVPAVGALVLIKEDNLPPMKWALGRILELHPGQDKVVRVVTIRTATGTLKRPTTKICLLPSAEDT